MSQAGKRWGNSISEGIEHGGARGLDCSVLGKAGLWALYEQSGLEEGDEGDGVREVSGSKIMNGVQCHAQRCEV